VIQPAERNLLHTFRLDPESNTEEQYPMETLPQFVDLSKLQTANP
jgi:hypothetical protein